MKKIYLALLIGASLLFSATLSAQTALVCNDLVQYALSDDCSDNISSEVILEGGPYLAWDHYIVELDKIAPYGNGPWVPALVTGADVGKQYQIRVTEPTTGNKCWGNIKIIDHPDCSAFIPVVLDANEHAFFTPQSVLPLIDLNYCGLNPVITSVNGVPQYTVDCQNLGAGTINVAVQEGLNQTSCNVQTFVSDTLGVCDSCLVCPASLTITYNEAINTYLPALEAGNLAVFDVFGSADFNANCSWESSYYGVNYQPQSLPYSWFLRKWITLDNNQNQLSYCEQAIAFENRFNIDLNGTVYLDSVQNCTKDALEPGIAFATVRITKLPSGVTLDLTPDAAGHYLQTVTVTGVDTMLRVELILPAGMTPTCPNIYEIPLPGASSAYTNDFGVRYDDLCANPEVSIFGTLFRRCFSSYLYVNYSNASLIAANDAVVEVTLDSLFTLSSSSIPWTAVNGNTYTFLVGNIPPFGNGTFALNVYLSCDANIGETLCNTATINLVNDPCSNQLSWNGAFIETSAVCDGDSVRLSIWNTGTADMTNQLEFIVIEDIIMYREGNFLLPAGDSMQISMPANGATWRIEAQQVPGYPAPDQPSSVIEACGGLNNPGLVNAFPLNDAPLDIDIDCQIVVGSWDPNDKSATPTGYGPGHYIRNNTDIEYAIRFQNTGTDTAFRVVILDTLSQYLQHDQIRVGSSSHPYKLDILQGGIMRFVFDPIYLPDSNVNEVASHGFVTFRIAQKPDLPDGVVITNKASIYFDFNDAVVTNEVWHTIGELAGSVPVHQPYVAGVEARVQPNPFTDETMVILEGVKAEQAWLTLYDAHGRQVRTITMQNNLCRIQGGDLPDGLYWFRIQDGQRLLATGRVMRAN